MSEDMEFRRALPLDYLDYMGVVNADIDDPRRKVFLEKITRIMSKLIQYALVDGAADQMGANHLHNCLPPCLTESKCCKSMLSLCVYTLNCLLHIHTCRGAAKWCVGEGCQVGAW